MASDDPTEAYILFQQTYILNFPFIIHAYKGKELKLTAASV